MTKKSKNIKATLIGGPYNGGIALLNSNLLYTLEFEANEFKGYYERDSFTNEFVWVSTKLISTNFTKFVKGFGKINKPLEVSNIKTKTTSTESKKHLFKFYSDGFFPGEVLYD